MVKPYKETYFNVMALTDEAGVLICVALFSNTIFINPGLNRFVLTAIGYSYGVVVSLVIVLNYIFTLVYFRARNPPVLELHQDYSMPVQPKGPV